MGGPSHTGHRWPPLLGTLVTAPAATEWEQWAVAHHYVEKHGDEAPIVIPMRADRLLEQGDVLGANTYVAMIRKSEQLLNRNGDSLQ